MTHFVDTKYSKTIKARHRVLILFIIKLRCFFYLGPLFYAQAKACNGSTNLKADQQYLNLSCLWQLTMRVICKAECLLWELCQHDGPGGTEGEGGTTELMLGVRGGRRWVKGG